MGKILSEYHNNTDRAWFDSSNVLYAECDDKEQELKEVKVTFKNGSTYAYHKVKVNDWLMFREAASTGKGLNAFIKQYECEKIDSDKTVDEIKDELAVLLEAIENAKNAKPLEINQENMSLDATAN